MAGHPLHPAVVPIPIGLLSAAAASDLGYLVTGERFFARMSQWLIGGGLVGGVAAGLLGLVDFSTIRAARGSTGITHAAGNTAVLAISAASLALRRTASAGKVPRAAIGLTAAAAGLLVVTGWLGGELAFRERIGVIPTEER